MADLRPLSRTVPRILYHTSIPRHALRRSFATTSPQSLATTLDGAPIPSRSSSATSPSQSGPRVLPSQTGPAGYTRRPPTALSDRLNAGPSFSDFVSNPQSATISSSVLADADLSLEDALELRTPEEAPRIGDAKTGRELRKVMVGPEGNRREVTRLPEWLRTERPKDQGLENYRAIKKDLRGLGLHTGRLFCSFYVHNWTSLKT